VVDVLFMKAIYYWSSVIVTVFTMSLVCAEPSSFPEGLTIYPKGKVFPFMGYSGNPVRDAQNGFSVTGPDYGTSYAFPEDRRNASYSKMRAAGLPYPAMVGLKMYFHDKKKLRSLTAEQIQKEIATQMADLLKDPLVCWWYISPEEIRSWRKNEMDYLKVVTETIHKLDPHHRPIWMYEPNHRDAGALLQTGKYLDIVGKGCYTNLAGFQKNRVWVRWSVEQEIKAVEQLFKQDGRTRTALVMPELCQDPKDPADDYLIPVWTRHDVYLGLMSGAKGVAIWSLFKRPGVKRTWQIWYDSYSQLAKELTGELALGKVFLQGKENAVIKVHQTSGPEWISLFVGDRTKLELGTITEAERKGGLCRFPALSCRVLDYNGSTYLFLCNSHPEKEVKVTIFWPHLPQKSKVFRLPENDECSLSFSGEGNESEIKTQLAPFSVEIYRFSQ
jgi:hypothetical protein